MIRELRARGLDPERQLAALGIGYSEEDDLHQFLSAAQFESFVHMTEVLSGDPNIGLLAGCRIRAEDASLLGLLMRASHDVQSAQAYLQQYDGGAVDPGFDAEILSRESVLVCRRILPGVRASRTLSEHFLARAATMTRHLLGPVQPLEVSLMHPEPPNIQEHLRILGERLRFGASEDAIVFPAGILSRPMLHQDPTTTAVILRYFARLPGAAASVEIDSTDVAAQARRIIQEQLHRGRVRTRQVSDRLEMDERTLRRQLADLGTSFQRLLDEVRRDEAAHYLRESRFSMVEISARLSFNGPAAFHRAFRRWTGVSPAEYRARPTSTWNS